MKSVIISAVALVALTVGAAADEMNGRFDWSGFYVGANGGAGYFEGATTNYQGGISSTSPVDGVGGLVGATVGANIQFGQAVFGIEGDFQWDSFDERRTWFDPAGDYVNEASWDWFGTIRARGGVAFDRALVYATGGVSVASVNHRYGSPDQAALFATPLFVQSHSDVEWGFAVGGGVEYALTDHITFKSEYIYVGIPTASEDNALLGSFDFKSSAQLARVGLNYKLF